MSEPENKIQNQNQNQKKPAAATAAPVTTSAITRPSQTLVQVTFTIDGGAAPGARNVSVRFNNAGGPQRTITGAFTVN